MPRLLRALTRAFVDRASINWDAARRRGRSGVQTHLELLRSLDVLRIDGGDDATRLQGARQLGRLLPAGVLCLSAVQILLCIVILTVTFTRGEQPFGRGLQLLLALAFAAGGFAVFAATSAEARTLAISAWFATVASAFLRHSLTGLPTPVSGALGIAVHSVTPDAFMPGCAWTFATRFPHVQRFTRFDVWAQRVGLAAWLLGGILFTVNLFGAFVALEPRLLARLLRSDPSRSFWHLITLAMCPAIVAIAARAHRAPWDERRRVTRLAAAIAGGTAPFLLISLAGVASPTFNRWIFAATAAERLWLDLFVVIGLAATPLLVAAAIVIDRPFELRARFRRAFRFALARHALSALLLAPFVIIVTRLYQLRQLTLADVARGSDAWLMMGSLAAFVLLILVRPRLLRALDQRESRRRAEHQQQLAAGLERIRLARGTREIGAVLEHELREGTGACTVHVMTTDGADGCTDVAGRLAPLPPDSALLAMLRHVRVLDVAPGGSLHSLLPRGDRQWVDAHEIAVVVPIVHRDDSLAGIVALGAKRGGIGFDTRDAWLVTTMSAAAAAAWAASRDAAGVDGVGPSPAEAEAAWECPSCGGVIEALPLPCDCGSSPRLAALPARLDTHLRVVRRIGAGGMGIVYLGRDSKLARDVALKTLPSLAPGATARLVEEARAMAALSHAALATIHDLRTWRRTPILMVEFLPHGTLAARLTQGPLQPADVLRLGEQIATALAVMHDAGWLHRDLKPSNIGLTADGSPKLLDFGLASLTTIGTAGAAGGTPAYLPPEAFDGSPPAASWDLWALAVVLLETATGHNPFIAGEHDATSHRRAAGILETLVPRMAMLPAPVRALLRRALAPEIGRRFATAAELRATLVQARRETST